MIKNIQLKTLGLIILGLLSFQSMFAQENFMPAYVIKNNSDTLHGFIDYREWNVNPDKIRFKENNEREAIYYSPFDITEFKVAHEIYVSGTVNVEVSPTSTENLVENASPNMIVVTTFLQTIIKGDKSLYYYKNFGGRESFYIKSDSAFELLLYKRYLKNNLGKKVIMENKSYIGQLFLYLDECRTITSKIENTSYKVKSLSELFQYYYGCFPSNLTFLKNTNKLNTEVGMLVGASNTSLEFKSASFKELVNANYPRSTNFSTGIFLNINLSKDQKKWSIYNELLYSTYSVSGQYNEVMTAGNYRNSYTSIGMTYFKLNNMIRYYYPVGKLNLFINGGISHGLALSELNYKIVRTKLYYMEREEISNALTSTKKYEQGFLAGAGINYNKLSLELRYETSNGMSKYTALKSEVKRIFFLFGYRF